MKKILTAGPFFVILAALLWSADGLLRISLFSLPPAVIVFYEHLLGAFLLLFAFPLWLPEVKKMTKKEWLAIGIVSLLSGALGTIFYTAALANVQYSQYSVVVLLQQQLQPLWAIATATLLLKEKVTKKFFLWASIALLGAYFTTFKDGFVNFNTGSGTLLAGMFALLAGLGWGSSTAISRFALLRVSFLTATALRFFLAPLFALLFIITFNQTDALRTISTDQLKTLVLITCSTGMVALGIYYYGLKRTPARITTLCELVWPASAVLIDYVKYGKLLSLTQCVGIAILLFAILNVTRPVKEKVKKSKTTEETSYI